MITYVDTSTLIKIIIDEVGSDAAATIWDTADELVTAHITFVEAVAAMAAAARGKRLDSERHRQAKVDLADLWEQFTICEVTADVITDAADLAERHGLHGYDAVHLASALKVEATILTSADQRLCEAAQICGLHVANPLRQPTPLPVDGATDPDGDEAAVLADLERSLTSAGRDSELARRMSRDSGLFGIRIPDNAEPLPESGFDVRALGVGTIRELVAYYRDQMAIDGWIYDADYSVVNPYDMEATVLGGYYVRLFFTKPTNPVVTVALIIGNEDRLPGHKRDLVIRLTETPDDDLPRRATDLRIDRA